MATGAGGLAARFVATPEWMAPLTAVSLIGWGAARHGERDALAAGLLLASIGALACGWAGVAWRWFPDTDLGRFARDVSGPVCLELIATHSPTTYPADPPSSFRAIPSHERTVVAAQVTSLRDGERWRPIAGRCELTVTGRLDDVDAGDRLVVFGQLRSPQPAKNPGERDAARRDRAERRLATVWTEAPECVEVSSASGNSSWTRTVEAFRRQAAEQIDHRLGEAAAPIARAMLLGDNAALDRNVVEAFRRTGALHVLVVSGLHVGLAAIGPLALSAIGLAPRRLAWVAAMLLVVGYVVMAGARPPAVRAGIVAGAACVAAFAGRRPISVNSLAGAAVAVFAASPAAWLGVGTQLSFLATATLLGAATFAARRRAAVLSPLDRLIRSTQSRVERVASRARRWFGWALAASVAVFVATGPLIASEFHLVSPLSAPLAVVLSPVVAVAVSGGLGMIAADALASLAGVFEPLAATAAWACDGAITVLLQTVAWTAKLSIAGVDTAGPADWWPGAWIGLLALAGANEAYGWRLRGLVARGVLALLAVGLAPTIWRAVAPNDNLRCSFLAVGHGSATLVQTPDGRSVLIDAGALGAPERVADTVARALWARGVVRLDAVVLSHPDVDHYNALPGLVERFDVDGVWASTRMFPRSDDPDDRSGPAELYRLLMEGGVPIRTLRAGDRLAVGEARIVVLHPDDLGVIGSDNANSLVLGVEHASRRVLLPGDLESPGLDFVLAQEPYDCDLLLAPHHGSERSDPPGFARWCRPESVVISSGGPPAAAQLSYQEAGAEVLSTFRDGMITALVGPRSVELSRFRTNPVR